MAKKKSKNDKDDDRPSTSQEVKNSGSSNGIWQDERFQHLIADPRFKNLPKHQRKVKIDKRFQSMFTDKKFNVKYTVDKYGRRVNQSNSEDLKKYYELNSDEESSDEDDNNKAKEVAEEPEVSASEEEDIESEIRKEEKAISRDNDEEELEGNDALGSDGDDVPKTSKDRLFDPSIDHARGEGRVVTDSSSGEETTDDEDDPDTYMEHTWGELDADAERTEESTRRLAVCNMDWDRMRAIDIMVLLSSFLPPGGTILSVKIYLSEYGKERLEAEEKHGPAELVGLGREVNGEDPDGDFSNDSDEDDLVQEQDSDAEEGDTYHMEKLRQYQLNRLRYYYAVVECDRVATADKIYAECDGLEYESSATRIDLRFIPDDTSFDEDTLTDQCTDLPNTNSYQPRLFTNTALQQAKVDLTWDETAVERQEIGEKLLTGKLEEVDDGEIRKLVAYSSEEEIDSNEENDANEDKKELPQENEEKSKVKETQKPKGVKKKDDAINKYKALLAEINEKEQQKKNKKIEMEVSWDIGGGSDKDDEEDDEDEETTEKKPSDLTPVEKYLLKRSEKNKQRKLERKKKKLLAKGIDPDEANLNDSDSDGVPDGIDMNDPYFAEEFADGDFVDPKTKKREQKKKQKEKQAMQEEEAEKEAKELELLLDDDDEDQLGKQHFSLDKILKSEQDPKSKRKRRKILKKSKAEIAANTKEIEDNFQLNLDDDRFKAVFSSPLFNIDPTHSHFKKTKNMEKIIHEKLKRRHGVEVNGDAKASNGTLEQEEPEMKKPTKKLEQTLLIKSLKRKLQGAS